MPSGKKIKNMALSFEVEKNDDLVKSSNFPVFGYKSEDKLYFFYSRRGKVLRLTVKKGESALPPERKAGSAL